MSRNMTHAYTSSKMDGKPFETTNKFDLNDKEEYTVALLQYPVQYSVWYHACGNICE